MVRVLFAPVLLLLLLITFIHISLFLLRSAFTFTIVYFFLSSVFRCCRCAYFTYVYINTYFDLGFTYICFFALYQPQYNKIGKEVYTEQARKSASERANEQRLGNISNIKRKKSQIFKIHHHHRHHPFGLETCKCGFHFFFLHYFT